MAAGPVAGGQLLLSGLALVGFLFLGFGPWRDWLTDVAATALLAAALLGLAATARRLLGRPSARPVWVALLVAGVLVAAATVVTAAWPARIVEQVTDGSRPDGWRLTVIERRSLLRPDYTVEFYGASGDIERTWMVWRAAGRGRPAPYFTTGRGIEIIDGDGRRYQAVLGGGLKPQPQYCLGVLRCGEATGTTVVRR